MSVLLFNLQRKVQRWRSAPAGPAAASPGIRPRCWLDLVEPGLRHQGWSRGAPPPGVMLHLPAGSLALSKHSNPWGGGSPTSPEPNYTLHPLFQLCGGLEIGSCVLAYCLASSKMRTFERKKANKNKQGKQKRKKNNKGKANRDGVSQRCFPALERLLVQVRCVS